MYVLKGFVDVNRREKTRGWCDNRNKTKQPNVMFYIELFLFLFLRYPQIYPHIDFRTSELSTIQPMRTGLLAKFMGAHHEQTT